MGYYREDRRILQRKRTHLTLLPYHNLGSAKKRNLGQKPADFVTPSDDYVDKIKKFFEEEAGMMVEVLGKTK